MLHLIWQVAGVGAPYLRLYIPTYRMHVCPCAYACQNLQICLFVGVEACSAVGLHVRDHVLEMLHQIWRMVAVVAPYLRLLVHSLVARAHIYVTTCRFSCL